MSNSNLDLFYCRTAIDAWALAYEFLDYPWKQGSDSRGLVIYPSSVSELHNCLMWGNDTVSISCVSLKHIRDYYDVTGTVDVHPTHPAHSIDVGCCLEFPNGTFVFDGCGGWFVVMERVLYATSCAKHVFPVSNEATRRACYALGADEYVRG